MPPTLLLKAVVPSNGGEIKFSASYVGDPKLAVRIMVLPTGNSTFLLGAH
jgi:hypothetical protein